MTIVHWRSTEHYNSAARKTVCGLYYDYVQTSHHHQSVTCLRCQRSPEWQQAIADDRAAFVRETF